MPPNPPPQPKGITPAKWRSWWTKLPAVGKIGFLGGASCADVDNCVGVLESNGKCVCYGDGLRSNGGHELGAVAHTDE